MATATVEKKPLSEAQKANIERLKQRNAARAVRAASAVAPAPAADEGGDDILALMADFTKRFGAAKGKRAEQAKIATQIAELIDKVDWEQYPELLADEKILGFIETVSERRQVPGVGSLPPGSTISKGPFIEDKKQWTWADIAEEKIGPDGKVAMPWVDYTPRGLPNGRQYVCWNGLEFIFVEDQTVHVPKCFVDVLEESYRGMKRAHEHANILMKQISTASTTDLLDPATIRIRSALTGGAFSTNLGLNQIGPADPYLAELDAKLQGEDGGEEGENA